MDGEDDFGSSFSSDAEEGVGTPGEGAPMDSDELELRPKQPLRFLKGLHRGGLPFFAFDPTEFDDLVYESRYQQYRKSLPPSEPGYLSKKRVVRAHVSTCGCVDCRRKRSQRQRDTVRAAFAFRKGNLLLVSAMMRKNGFLEARLDGPWNLCWSLESILPSELKTLRPFQKINIFPKTTGLVAKDQLYRNIMKMMEVHGAAHYSFLPKAFILPNEQGVFEQFCADHPEEGPWIIKPSQKSQGKGIYITRDPRDILSIVALQEEEKYVVTKYILFPLIVDNLKFDLRLYVLVTCVDPLRIYLYNEGMVRFATEAYTTEDSSFGNQFIHLTNFSINKYSENFVDCMEEDEGSKWTLSALRRALEENDVHTDALFQDIEDLIIKTILSVEDQVFNAMRAAPTRTSCFELFGFDILIDENVKPWLLEVNMCPSLNVESPLDNFIKAPMLADTLTVIGLQPYDPKTGEKKPPEWTDLTSRDHRDESRSEYLGFGRDLSDEDVLILKELESEYKRRGNYKRLYPREDSAKFNRFFVEPRRRNTLVCNFVFKQAMGEEGASASKLAAIQSKAGRRGK